MKTTFSPKQAVSVATKVPVGAGFTEIVTGLLIFVHERPLSSEIINLRKSVVDEIIAEGERTSCDPSGARIFTNGLAPILLCH